jgi:hypothetical protein
MHDLPTWGIVVGCAVIAFIFVLLLCFLLIVLLSWWAGVSEPPTLVLFVTGKIARYFRRRRFQREPGPATEPVNSDPVAASPTSLPPTNSGEMVG